MTYEEYIKNPFGDKNAVMTQREVLRTMYTNKLNIILVREANRIDYKIYSRKDTIYFHIKVPSEVVPKFYYDVVIKFTQPKKAINTIYESLDKCDVEFFSNDPAFVFTFAHAFIKNKLFIDELKSKMSKEAVKNTAKEKNPSNQVGYVKSLYFAYLIIKSKGLFNYNRAKAESVIYNEAYLLSQIENADKKINDRQEAGKELTSKKRVNDKKTNEDIKRDVNHAIHNPDNSGFRTKNTKIIKPIKPIMSTKKTNLVKQVKKIKTR